MAASQRSKKGRPASIRRVVPDSSWKRRLSSPGERDIAVSSGRESLETGSEKKGECVSIRQGRGVAGEEMGREHAECSCEGKKEGDLILVETLCPLRGKRAMLACSKRGSGESGEEKGKRPGLPAGRIGSSSQGISLPSKGLLGECSRLSQKKGRRGTPIGHRGKKKGVDLSPRGES